MGMLVLAPVAGFKFGADLLAQNIDGDHFAIAFKVPICPAITGRRTFQMRAYLVDRPFYIRANQRAIRAHFGAVAVAKMLGRDFIGIEREEAYRKVAAERIARVRRFDASALEVTGSKRAEPRVPFGQVVERGMLRPGEELFSLGNRYSAKVRADGTLIGADVKGSIHQVGAHLEGAPSCNGWTYWHFKRDGKMIPIDILRQQIRAELESSDGRKH